MPKKRAVEKTQLQILDDKLQVLLAKRLVAYSGGSSPEIMKQIDGLIQMTQNELIDAKMIQEHRNNEDDGNGETFIV